MNLSDLHSVDPYLDFDQENHPSDVSGWNSDLPIFKQLIEGEMPKLIVEVGSWLGASAIHMAGCLKAAGLPNSKIVCVDTWLGSLEFWNDQLDQQRYQALGLKNGYPSVYYKFLANIVRAGHQDMIIPFPQTSAIAAKWFTGRQSDMVYLDASHDFSAVFEDLTSWWEVVKPGGVIFGDDYLQHMGVTAAVGSFAGGVGIQFTVDGGHWWIRKPS